MPPKVDLKTLFGKRDNAIHSLKELFDEFEAIYSVKPDLTLLQATFNEIESKYRAVKKQIETIADRLVEENITSEDERVTENIESGYGIKVRYLETLQKFGSYQKKYNEPQTAPVDNSAILGAVADAVKQMAESMTTKPRGSGLERLPVPSWDGSRKSYTTWKKEFNHWMSKYDQDKDEQLQRFPKGYA